MWKKSLQKRPFFIWSQTWFHSITTGKKGYRPPIINSLFLSTIAHQLSMKSLFPPIQIILHKINYHPRLCTCYGMPRCCYRKVEGVTLVWKGVGYVHFVARSYSFFITRQVWSVRHHNPLTCMIISWSDLCTTKGCKGWQILVNEYQTNNNFLKAQILFISTVVYYCHWPYCVAFISVKWAFHAPPIQPVIGR